jgi:ribose transport system substrate-binding protein
MKITLALAALVILALSQSPSASQAAPAPGKKWVIGMSQCNLGEPWRVQMNADIAKAASAHPEIEVIFKDAQNDTLRQRAQIEEFINAKVDLLIVSPKEAAPLTPPIAAAYKQGIPVVVLDRKVLGNDYTAFIGADNRKIGKAAGEWISKYVATRLGGQARLVELKGLMTSTPAQDRHQGFREGLDHGGAAVATVFDADMKWLEPEARKEMESALSTQPKLDVVYAHNDPGAHGAYLAAAASGRQKQMIFVGIDGLPQEGQAYVKQGILSASFEYPTGGREAIDTAMTLLQGGPNTKVQKQLTLRSHVYTRENIARGGEWLN